MVEILFLAEDYYLLPGNHQSPTQSNRLAPGLNDKTRLSYQHIACPLALAYLRAGHFVQAISSKLDILSIQDLRQRYIPDIDTLESPNYR